MARARLDELKKSQVAVVVPPVVPALPPASAPCGGGAVSVSLSSRAACPLSAAEERALKPKDSFKECGNCPAMVVVPAGRFTMGSPASEWDRESDEGPQHTVSIAAPFAVGKFAVTFDEWDACVDDQECHRRSDEEWGRGRRPVINVTWDDAKTYVAWLSRKTGKTYRLLSEAEWEYAARAGTGKPFWWGSSSSTGEANYNGDYTYGAGRVGESRERTVPVDWFQPNPFGLYQMNGNVWEWTEDCWHKSYHGAPANGAAWTNGDCNNRILRGGSWFAVPKFLRAAFRATNVTSKRLNNNGFRVARKLAP
jgi:formylglycine-generating enzyme required for sulfatase activity